MAKQKHKNSLLYHRIETNKKHARCLLFFLLIFHLQKKKLKTLRELLIFLRGRNLIFLN